MTDCSVRTFVSLCCHFVSLRVHIASLYSILTFCVSVVICGWFTCLCVLSACLIVGLCLHGHFASLLGHVTSPCGDFDPVSVSPRSLCVPLGFFYIYLRSFCTSLWLFRISFSSFCIFLVVAQLTIQGETLKNHSNAVDQGPLWPLGPCACSWRDHSLIHPCISAPHRGRLKFFHFLS